MLQTTKWWQNHTRVIQTNLQIRDTDKIDPAGLAREIEELGGNVLVFNVGGIYAWYDSQVQYHHVNEELPAGRDLLKEVIDACHARGILFVARYDFSKTDDTTYLAHPDWFMRDAEGLPRTIGAHRPGPWNLLYSTCINSPYWNEAVAEPVLRESISRYDLDGVFFNAVHPTKCWCPNCRRKYRQLFGVELPNDASAWHPEWITRQMQDNVSRLAAASRATNPDIPVILYYWDGLTAPIAPPMSDVVCDESQNILSLGIGRFPRDWKPALRMKLTRSVFQDAPPFGIIHSSPGMDWRHTGLPTAEYRYWLAQVPANGGAIWHSLTGIPATIPDKRILATIQELNENIKTFEDVIDQAIPYAEAALLWNPQRQPHGWLKTLFEHQIQFDIVRPDVTTQSHLQKYQVVIAPFGYPWTADIAQNVCAYVRKGGRMVIEGPLPETYPELAEICGIKPEQLLSENLLAAYIRLEEDRPLYQEGPWADTPIIGFRGPVAYSKLTQAVPLATLVPPFAPLEAVGAPPERANLPVTHTDIALCMENQVGAGKVTYLAFNLNDLINDYGMDEHQQLAAQLVTRCLTGRKLLTTSYPGLYASLFSFAGGYLMHLVNGAGLRPLTATLPLGSIQVTLRTEPGQKISQVCDRFSQTNLAFSQTGDQLRFSVDLSGPWKAIVIQE